MESLELARCFALGGSARLSEGLVARGKQGVVGSGHRRGQLGGEGALRATSEEEVREATAFQEAAYAAGVPTPQVRRTTAGAVFPPRRSQARMYTWADLRAPDTRLDPAQVGTVVALIHRVSDDVDMRCGPLDPWYSAPVGGDRWDQLVEQLREAEAPFASQLAALRDELVGLESWIEPPRVLATCHRDLWADNLLATNRRRSVRHRLGEHGPG